MDWIKLQGLSFSVPDHTSAAFLQNILSKNYAQILVEVVADHLWAEQGGALLNARLMRQLVRLMAMLVKFGSLHRCCIKVVNELRSLLSLSLWGSYARNSA